MSGAEPAHFVVGPGDFLVLIAPVGAAKDWIYHVRAQLPEDLQDRVLMVGGEVGVGVVRGAS